MISIFAFSLWLWVCLSVQAPAQGAFKLKTVKRVDHGNGTLEFIVDFKGDSSTEAVWWKTYDNVETLQGTTEGGTTRLSVLQKDFDGDTLFLNLGDMSRQYYLLSLKTDGSGDKLSELNLKFSTVNPGTDVAYVPGTKKKVVIKTDENRGAPHLSPFDYDIGISLECMAQNGTKFTTDNPDFVKISTKRENGMVTNALVFESDDPINCYFESVVDGVPVRDQWQQSALEMALWEYTVLTIHEEGKEIGFPHSDPFTPM